MTGLFYFGIHGLVLLFSQFAMLQKKILRQKENSLSYVTFFVLLYNCYLEVSGPISIQTRRNVHCH